MNGHDVSSHADTRIAAVVARMAVVPGVLAVLLAGSRATGLAGPRSDVDLLAIVADGAMRRDIFDADDLTFDTSYWTIEELEERIASDGVTCDLCRQLVTLAGDPAWEARIEATARRLYPAHVPDEAQQVELRAQVRIGAQQLTAADTDVPTLALAIGGGDLVWNATKGILATVGIGPLREVHWHDTLRAANLPFDVATAYAQWHTGGTLAERIPAALRLAEFVLGGPMPPSGEPVVPPLPPAFSRRERLDPEEAVELHRMIRYGLGKYDKAVWTGDPVRQASEASTILWFAMPACLALAGVRFAESGWWRTAPRDLGLPFDVGGLYRTALTGDSLATRLAAAQRLGEQAQAALEPIFRDTPYAMKYRRM